MTARLNEQVMLLALGVLQPSSAPELRGYLAQMFSSAGIIPDVAIFESFLIQQEKLGRIITVASDEDRRFALTYQGSEFLNPATRKIRDKLRLFLLRDAHRRRILLSRADVAKELAGASPAIDYRSTVKGREANDLGLRYSLGQARWPRISRQFKRTGSSPSARDNLGKFVSFDEAWQLRIACELPQIGPLPDTFEWNFRTLGIAFGISPGLITQILRRKSRHYRVFSIKKSNGKSRAIESPRIFLKVILWLIHDFIFLPRLKISNAAFAFRFGRTAISNAQEHVGANFVGNIDIRNFFNSISDAQIAVLLRSSGFALNEANMIADLCTKDGRLPQGAPTSPILSNALLYEFDEAMLQASAAAGCKFTRYADDISISGPSREAVIGLLKEAEGFLMGRYSLALNPEKTRVASSGGRQVVTGVVVNALAQPSRKYRKNIRATFHRAKAHPQKYMDSILTLTGYVGYLSQFTAAPVMKSVVEYREALTLLKDQAQKARDGVKKRAHKKRPTRRKTTE